METNQMIELSYQRDTECKVGTNRENNIIRERIRMTHVEQ